MPQTGTSVNVSKRVCSTLAGDAARATHGFIDGQSARDKLLAMTTVLIIRVECKVGRAVVLVHRLVDLRVAVQILRLGICVRLQHTTELTVCHARGELVGIP